MKKKAFLIARVSDKEQRKALPAQKLKLVKYAEEQDFDYELIKFDESAYKSDRRKFATFIKNKIESYPDNCIVVFDKIDRFSRDSSQEEVRLFNELRLKNKIEMHFPSDNLVVTKESPATDLFRLGIGLALAKYYSDSISDNVKRRLEQLVKEEKQWPGKAPIGYTNKRLSEKETTIVPDPERAKYIVKAFELRTQGMAVDAITKILRKEGLQNNTSLSRPISRSHVGKILQNPFYYGVLHPTNMTNV
ncbi:recombinase family protein [Candidatus Saccharibacteria bacterium]|nr:recombinase family protein [Candidatus Saccharibacteria bacterium]